MWILGVIPEGIGSYSGCSILSIWKKIMIFWGMQDNGNDPTPPPLPYPQTFATLLYHIL